MTVCERSHFVYCTFYVNDLYDLISHTPHSRLPSSPATHSKEPTYQSNFGKSLERWPCLSLSSKGGTGPRDWESVCFRTVDTSTLIC